MLETGDPVTGHGGHSNRSATEYKACPRVNTGADRMFDGRYPNPTATSDVVHLLGES